MRQKLIFEVTPVGDKLYVANRSTLRSDLCDAVPARQIPRKKYCVTYRLNPRGAYKVCGTFIERVHGELKGREFRFSFNCLLPDEWVGKRVSREVEVTR